MPADPTLESFLLEPVQQRDRILRLFVRVLNEAAPLPEQQVLALTTRLSRPDLSDTDIRNATRLFADLPHDLRLATDSASRRLARAARAGALEREDGPVKTPRVAKLLKPLWTVPAPMAGA